MRAARRFSTTTCARSGRASLPSAPTSAPSTAPGEICQFDLWEPRQEIPVGHDQTRRGWVVTSALGYSRAGARALIFAKQAPDILWGMGRCLAKLGALPETVVWDREAAIAPKGRPTEAFAAFCGALPVGWSICEAEDPESKGVLKRSHRFALQLRTGSQLRLCRALPSLPGRVVRGSAPTLAFTAASVPSRQSAWPRRCSGMPTHHATARSAARQPPARPEVELRSLARYDQPIPA